MSVAQYLALVPPIMKLVSHVVETIKDRKLEPEEVKEIGEDLVAIVTAIIRRK